MLSLSFSNRFEALQDALLLALETDAAPEADAADRAAPLQPAHVIVPGAAHRLLLSQAVARAQGVCAHVAFSGLEEWLWAQAARLHPQAGALAALASPALAWRVFRLLGEPDVTATHPRLGSWLNGADEPMRWDLARRGAALLQQVLAYRGDWLQAWSEGHPAELGAEAPDQPWLAALWQRLRHELGAPRAHPVQPVLQALEDLDDAALRAAGLPQRVHVFALPAIAPLHLALLQALSRRMDVGLYVLNPCREYWFEVVDARRIARLEQRGQALYHEVGQRLLAAWGRQTQAHLDLLLEAASEAGQEDSAFIPDGAPTLLAQLHDAVLEMRELEPAGVALAADDRSIEVHVACSRTRELEALHDTLLAAFAADETLRPSDVLVVTPDLAATAPLVEAVFGTVPGERFIPYAVSGRPASAVNAPARVLLALLTLAGSRFAAGGVFELLQSPPVARRFHMDAAALEQVRAWLDEASIRWGLDGGRHSFAEGLSRLYLGYALPDEVLEPLGERLPVGAVDGDEAPALGAFWRFVHELRRLAQRLSQPLPAAQWRAALLEAAQALVAPEDAAPHDWRALHRALNALDGHMRAAAVEEPLCLPLVRAALLAQLDEGAAEAGVPTGQVSFASMAALRNVPFRVVCVLGLDDGAYPAAQRPAELDLLALAPRRGDPQRRLEERNVFLDLLLAARERLVLSCVGRSERDGAPRPPSVLVSELLDVLVPAIAADGSPAALAAARARLVVEHPLAPFSPAAFDPSADPRQRSFDAELAQALRQAPTAASASDLGEEALRCAAAEDGEDDAAAAADALVPGATFFPAPLPPPAVEWRAVALEQLVEFFRQPCRYLLRRRLGVELPRADERVDEDEPLLPDWASRRALAQRLLPALAQPREPSQLQRLAVASGDYPGGRLGGLLLRRELQALSDYAGALREAPPAAPAPFASTLEIAVDGEAWTLSAARADLRPDGLWLHRYGDVGAQDLLEAWLWHLWLCASRPEGVAPRTRWQARDGSIEFEATSAARARLAELLRLYRQGLMQPLRFFPRAAWAFMEHKESLNKARAVWRGHPQRPGEGADEAYRLALRGVAEPLDAEFVRCARAVFGPLRRCLRDGRV
jgi:exodeoxyribonuclease V gamma subunit